VAFEGARKLQAIIFDKTGTLTEGRFGVTDTLVLSQDINEDTLRKYAASVDANSEHPSPRPSPPLRKRSYPSKASRAFRARGGRPGRG